MHVKIPMIRVSLKKNLGCFVIYPVSWTNTDVAVSIIKLSEIPKITAYFIKLYTESDTADTITWAIYSNK